MRERINRLAKGIMDTEQPKLFLKPEKVEETVGASAIYKNELYLASENTLYIKGLAYSSHPRVRVQTPAFGGLRNHIVYEVDTSWCENGDSIAGSFWLVTNSGEIEVPFLFHVEMASSVRVITTLRTVEDFAKVAQDDMDLALRLMEYQDFLEAPFLKDMHIRAIYQGLKGYGNRQNALEEFFLALGKKEPISLTVSASQKSYDFPQDVINDKIILKKNTWGYLYIELRADGDFIELAQKTVTQADFDEDRFDLRFKILPKKLHRGKNLGAIRLLTVRGDVVIPVEAMGGTAADITDRKNEVSKAAVCRYLRLREVYEAKIYEDAVILHKIQKELDDIRGAIGNSLLLFLFQAENYLDSGRAESASLILDECRESILAMRDRQQDLYCFYQYLQYQTAKEAEKMEALSRLLERRISETVGNFYPLFLLLKLRPELYEDYRALYERLKLQYRENCHSPFLYITACRLLNEHPELLASMDRFEIHVLYYGAGRGMVQKALASRVAALASGAKFFHRLYYRAMAALYETYKTKEFLAAVCSLLIKGNNRREESFAWYEKAVEEEISLTRLYEYFLYSLPESYEKMLPKQVLLYFSYEHSQLDRDSRSALYKNVLTYLEPDSPLYRSYEREISKFAMDQLFQSRINGNLAVIYKHMLYKDVIDEQVAKVLPAILKSNRVVCMDAAMKYVVVINEVLTGEDAYPLYNGVAYVPVFFDESILLFQDAFGNRYMDVDYTMEPALEEKELEDRCFMMAPEHPMLKMRACLLAMKKKRMSGADAALLEQIMEEMPLKPLYKEKVLGRLIACYRAQPDSREKHGTGRGGEYLLRLDKKKLSRKERIEVCEALISQDYYKEAFQMVACFGAEGLNPKRLLKLCTKIILQKLFDADDLLLALSWQVFRAGKGEGVILDYLCDHYNGVSGDMYALLSQSVSENVETYDLEERLLAQLLFVNSDSYLDEVFDLYASRKKTSEAIVKAYFTVKSVDYFLKEKTPGGKVFSYLEGAVFGSPEMRKVPEIYLLALSKYYAGLEVLNEEQAELCGRMMAPLLESGMVFSWFKNLAPYVELPGDVLNKEIIEYHGSTKARPVLMVRVLPDEEEFSEEPLRMVYKGIYIRQKLLFEGEIMEYRIYEDAGDGERLMAEGSVTCNDVPAGDKSNRFSALNAMTVFLNEKKDKKLKNAMKKYVTDNLSVEKLFPLM